MRVGDIRRRVGRVLARALLLSFVVTSSGGAAIAKPRVSQSASPKVMAPAAKVPTGFEEVRIPNGGEPLGAGIWYPSAGEAHDVALDSFV